MLASPANDTTSARNYRDILAIVFCLGQTSQALAIGLGLHFMAKSIVNVLTAGQSIKAIHASRLATAVTGSTRPGANKPGLTAGTGGATVIVLTVTADPATLNGIDDGSDATSPSSGGSAGTGTATGTVTIASPTAGATAGVSAGAGAGAGADVLFATRTTPGAATTNLSPAPARTHAPAKTTVISAERLEFAERLTTLRDRVAGLTRNQAIIYLLFAFVPVLRSRSPHRTCHFHFKASA
jgi:hypothetical protein